MGEFTAQLARFRPEIVVMDGMFEESDTSIGAADLARLKTRYGFKLITLIADCYPPLPNYAAAWASVSDLTVSLTGEEYLNDLDPGRTFLSPCQALAASLIRAASADSERNIDLLYAGARTRNRDFWCAHAVMAGIDMTVAISDRRAHLGQSETTFYETLGRAKLALSNGFVTPERDIVVFRPFEAAASGTVTLHNGASLARYFVPWVHYVPFETVDELICLTRFLLARPDYRHRIRDAMRDFWSAHYRGELFWRALFARISA